MGVSGSGKTTFGRALAGTLGWTFLDADDFHPHANREKMSTGQALTDADREPWLAALHAELRRRGGRAGGAAGPAVLACSALKRRYRARLREGLPAVAFIFLRVDPATVQRRLSVRRDHFFPPALLQSQLDALEPPAATEQEKDGGEPLRLLTLESARPLEENLAAAVHWLRAPLPAP